MLSLLAAAVLAAPVAERPPIVGVAYVALRTDDLAGARAFYNGELGLPVAPGRTDPLRFVVNDHQYVEVASGLPGPTADRLTAVAFETTDALGLLAYVTAHGIVPGELQKLPDGGRSFGLVDADGHRVEFVQRGMGKPAPEPRPDLRISTHMIHVGLVVKDQTAADRLYKDVLGFRAIWHGGMKDDQTDWVDMRVPDGSDWLEYMLNVSDRSPRTLGVMHHLALGISSVKEGYERVVARGAKPEPPQIGRDGKWQLNLYDPSLTRVELMEPQPVQTPCCSSFVE
jgi:catechol 2,3-dioxygenase-like lactoylglutathione lyase family enzyme